MTNVDTKKLSELIDEHKRFQRSVENEQSIINNVGNLISRVRSKYTENYVISAVNTASTYVSRAKASSTTLKNYLNKKRTGLQKSLEIYLQAEKDAKKFTIGAKIVAAINEIKGKVTKASVIGTLAGITGGILKEVYARVGLVKLAGKFPVLGKISVGWYAKLYKAYGIYDKLSLALPFRHGLGAGIKKAVSGKATEWFGKLTSKAAFKFGPAIKTAGAAAAKWFTKTAGAAIAKVVGAKAIAAVAIAAAKVIIVVAVVALACYGVYKLAEWVSAKIKQGKVEAIWAKASDKVRQAIQQTQNNISGVIGKMAVTAKSALKKQAAAFPGTKWFMAYAQARALAKAGMNYISIRKTDEFKDLVSRLLIKKRPTLIERIRQWLNDTINVLNHVKKMRKDNVSIDEAYKMLLECDDPILERAILKYLGKHMSNEEIMQFIFNSNGIYGGDQGNPMRRFRTDLDFVNFMRELLPEMTVAQIREYLSGYNSVGCGYMAAANYILAMYANKPDEFEKTFGFPLYIVDANGNVQPNFDMLAVSIYHNHGRDGLNGSERSGSFPKDAIEGYLRAHGVNVTVNKRDSFPGIREIRKDLQNGPITLSLNPCIMYDSNGVEVVTGPHAITITGVTENGDLIVSSWGRTYTVRISDYDNIDRRTGEYVAYDQANIKW